MRLFCSLYLEFVVNELPRGASVANMCTIASEMAAEKLNACVLNAFCQAVSLRNLLFQAQQKEYVLPNTFNV